MFKVYFYLKLIIGELLYKVGFLAEISIYYKPKYRIYFGRTWWQWKRNLESKEKIKKSWEPRMVAKEKEKR